MNCAVCDKPIDPTSPTTLQRIEGWERRALNASRRGGSDILLRQRRDEYAHESCVQFEKMGLSPAQESMSL